MKNIMIILVAMVALLGSTVNTSAQSFGVNNLPTEENGRAIVYSESESIRSHEGWEAYLTLDAATRRIHGLAVRYNELGQQDSLAIAVKALRAVNADRLNAMQAVYSSVGVERVDGFSISVGASYGELTGTAPEVGLQYTRPSGFFISATGGYVAEKEVFDQVNSAFYGVGGLGWRFRQSSFLAARPFVEGYAKFEQYMFDGVTASGDLDHNNALNTIIGVKAGLEMPLNARKGMTEGRKTNTKLVFAISYEFGEGTSYNGYISPEEYRGALETGFKPGVRVSSVNQIKFSIGLKFGQNKTQAKFK